jgi:hypothetical protein
MRRKKKKTKGNSGRLVREGRERYQMCDQGRPFYRTQRISAHQELFMVLIIYRYIHWIGIDL